MNSEPKSAYTVSKLVELWNQGVQHGVNIERAAVVAWLRGSDDDLVADYGDDIERGKHRRGEGA